MSWVDKVSQGIIIQTPDLKQYKPKWMNASFQTDYQTSTFEFIGVNGSLVKKTTHIGTKYNLEIYFNDTIDAKGHVIKDHLDIVNEFKVSVQDRRPWIVQHPLYDRLYVQVTSLNWDDSAYNITKVTGTMIETIVDGNFGLFVAEEDMIPIKFESTVNAFGDALSVPVQPQDINQLKQDNLAAYKKGVPVISTNGDFEGYFNAFNVATTYIDTATATPLLMMRAVMNVLTFPSQFTASAITRISLLLATFANLRATIFGRFTVSSKQLYQNQCGALVSAMCNCVAERTSSDFRLAGPILQTIDSIVNSYNSYVSDLDYMQTANAGNTTSYVADAPSMTSMNDLVNTTITALFNLTLSARSERSITVSKDTNWILLAHQLYGLDQNDQNINDLIEQNSTNGEDLNKYLEIQAGTKIVYYV